MCGAGLLHSGSLPPGTGPGIPVLRSVPTVRAGGRSQTHREKDRTWPWRSPGSLVAPTLILCLTHPSAKHSLLEERKHTVLWASLGEASGSGKREAHPTQAPSEGGRSTL